MERRRRETINEGINELKAIVPNCDKNKGSILASAVKYITELKSSEASNIEKWTLEKLLSDQAMLGVKGELEGWKRFAEGVEREKEQLREENERLKRRVEELEGGEATGQKRPNGAEGGEAKRPRVDE